MARVNSRPFPSIEREAMMNQTPKWDLKRYEPLLLLQVRSILQLDPRLRRRFDPWDLVQETFRRAWEKLDQFRGQTEKELLAWLRKILENVIRDELDKAHAQERDIDREQSIHDLVKKSSVYLDLFAAKNQSTPSEHVVREEFQLRFAKAVGQLPDAQRDVVILRLINEASIAQIAEQLGRTEKAVAGLLRRGLGTLRELLPEYKPEDQ
jgi:RNA polymerase sigma-70 factor (ECF subfamily)